MFLQAKPHFHAASALALLLLAGTARVSQALQGTRFPKRPYAASELSPSGHWVSHAAGGPETSLRSSQTLVHVRSIFRGLSSAVDQNTMETSFLAGSSALGKPTSTKTLFCYSLVRTPPEDTVSLLAKQLSSACDGWALFGASEDSTRHITKAFAPGDVKGDMKHQMHNMVAAGAWKHIAETGDLYKYEWFVKVDSDSFVRPSALRKAFEAQAASASEIISVSDTVGTTAIDGFFIAVRGRTAKKLQKREWPVMCDSTLSGNDEEQHRDPAGPSPSCLRSLGISKPVTLRDALGHAVIAIDQDPPETHKGDPGGPLQYGPRECEDMGKMLLSHHGGALCVCTLADQKGPSCVSQDFAIVHRVKDAETYSALVKAFK